MSSPHPYHDLAAGMPFLRWWSNHVVAGVDHQAVVEKVHEEAEWSPHFAVMTLLSAGIAILGLLLSSPAVVIGAMLISPLMGPIIGLGFALATFDSAEMRRTLAALAIGIAIAIAFCALIVLLSPLQTVTEEIASRTRPNLFDLLVALFSGLAGTYAMIRGRHGTIVGVAIATALMPPLAVVGFGLATLNWTVLAGSFLLFFTNFMTIAIAAAVLARIYGFATKLSPRQTRLQATLVVATLLALAVPLGLSLKQIAWEALASRQIREAISGRFGPKARLGQVEINYHVEPIAVAATVLTPRYIKDADREMTGRVTKLLHRPVTIAIDQLRTDDGEMEELRQVATKGSALDRIASRLVDRLALVAGVMPDQVLIDRNTKHALVRAALLPGASPLTYMTLEARVAKAEPGWTVTLIPPIATLPEVEFEGEELGVKGTRAIEAAAWMAKRLGLTIEVKGGGPARADKVTTLLTARGVDTKSGDTNTGTEVQLSWLQPSAT